MFVHFKTYFTEQNLFLPDEFLIIVLDRDVVTILPIFVLGAVLQAFFFVEK